MKVLFTSLLALTTLSARAEIFTLLIYEPESSFRLRTDQKSSYWADFSEYASKLQAAGILRGGTAFVDGPTVKHVKVSKDSVQVKDGAFIKKADILGGYLSIDVVDMEQAITWAKKAPANYGLHIDVRPSQVNPTMGMKK